MTTSLQFQLDSSTGGNLYTQEVSSQIAQALNGGQGVADFVQQQNDSGNFFSWAAENEGAWFWTTQQDTDYPVQAIAQQDGEGNLMYCQVSPVLDQDVIQGNTAPSTFVDENGNKYNQIGTVTTTFGYSTSTAWFVTIPLGLIELYPISQLMNLAWQGILQPVIAGVQNGIKTLISRLTSSQVQGDVDAAISDAAADSIVDGTAVGAETVSLGVASAALFGAGILIAIPFIIEAISHPTYHNVSVLNLTKGDIFWAAPWMAEGQMTLAPTMTSGSTTYNPKIPAITPAINLPGDNATGAYHSANFNFVSDTDLSGLAYLMGFNVCDPTNNENTLVQFMAIFDVPFAGENSLYCTWGTTPDPASLISSVEGEYKQLSQSSTSGAYTMTVTYDYLTGEHQGPTGQQEYIYNSVITISDGSLQPSSALTSINAPKDIASRAVITKSV